MPKHPDLSTEKFIARYLKEALKPVFIAKAAHFFIIESVALLLALVLTWGVA